MEIKGTFATAVCFAKTIEDTAAEQIRTMCSTPVTEGSQVRIMPDVHAGKGCTIGTTMTITDKVVPLRYNYDKPEKPRISRVFGYQARFFILFQPEKSSREVVIS